MSETSYALRYAKGQEFLDFATPGDVLRAAAKFSDEHGDQVYSVNLRWTPDCNYCATVFYEDVPDVIS